MGLLDSMSSSVSNGLMDPQSAGLLGLAQGLLASSGASRLPVPMGPALANGLAGAQQGIAGALNMRNQWLQNQIGMLNFQKTKELLDAANSMYGGPANMTDQSAVAMGQGAAQQPNQPIPSGMPMAPGMVPPLSQGGAYNLGGVGPTNANAARLAAPAPGPSVDPMNPLGLDPRMSRFGMLSDPAAYMKEAVIAPAAQRASLTDFERNLLHAGVKPNTPEYQEAMAGQIAKQNQMTGYRPGAFVPDGRGGFTALPAAPPPGFVTTGGPGSWGLSPMANGLPAVAASSGAASAGKAAGSTAFTPQTVYQDGRPGVMLGRDVFPGLSDIFRSPSPSTLPSSGTPVAGGATRAPGGFVQTGPGIGDAPYATSTATAAGNRANDLMSMAQDSPMRVNVLDNIIGLSQRGTQSGPTAEFTNQVKGYMASVPGFGGWKDDVSGFQELQKFLNQNAIRNWSAAGGTQTDSQLEAQMHANPNDRMFPQAIQHVAQWSKAGELALQAKANAWKQWQGQNGNNQQSQTNFENAWRQNFRPNDYIKQTIPQTNSKGWVLHQDKAGNIGYISPDGRQQAGIW
jgi:hypothetical protein